jgi:hypothetical protein
MTEAQQQALKWLADHTGDGIVDKHGCILAAGEIAPHTRATFNALRGRGLIEFYDPNGHGHLRIRVV